MPTRTRSKRERRPEDGRGRVGEVPERGLDTGAGSDVECVPERLLLLGVGRVLGVVAAREVRPDAGHLDVAVAHEVGSPSEQVQPRRAGRATAAEPGVDLDLHSRLHLSGGRDLVQLCHGVDGEVDVLRDRRRVVLARHREPAEDPPGVADRSQVQRLVDGRDTQPLRARVARGPGGLGHAVAVAVGLDHRHHRHVRPMSSRSVRTLCRIAATSTTISARAVDGGGHRVAVFHSAGGEGGTDRRGDGVRHVPRHERTVDRGDVGRRTVQPRPDARPRRTASSPAARSAPISPPRTSPAPAVASQAVPVVLARTRPSGAATRRAAALEQDDGVVALGGRARRAGVAEPRPRSRSASSSRAISPACGVRTAGTPTAP